MTADARAAAQAWLAEQICASAVEPEGRALDPPCGSCTAAANLILSAPGVHVETGAAHGPCEHWGISFDGTWFANRADWRPIRRLVIPLPDQPVKEGA